jgi:hypothetical protein
MSSKGWIFGVRKTAKRKYFPIAPLNGHLTDAAVRSAHAIAGI